MLLAQADRGVVVFKFARFLPYFARMLLSFAVITLGLFAQLRVGQLVAGYVLIFAGNLFLLVRGYDNRVDYKGLDTTAEWVPVARARLDELLALDRKMRAWHRSALDITNPLGFLVLALAVLGLGWLAFHLEEIPQMLAVDALLLFVPHWVTGVRRILRLPNMLVKVKLIKDLLAWLDEHGAEFQVQILTLVEKRKIPDDIKIKIDPKEKPDGFLGLYGQVVINNVQGTSYPYFYVVLVAKKPSALQETFQQFGEPLRISKEFSAKDGVDVFVLRQTTTREAGYCTKFREASAILDAGLGATKMFLAGTSTGIRAKV